MKLNYTVRIAQKSDIIHADHIVCQIEQASNELSNGICKRSKDLIVKKILAGVAVIAVTNKKEWVGFCYLQKWNDGFVSSCALIVSPEYRKENIAKLIKYKIFELAKLKYPNHKYFGLTTSLAVMKINSELGYKPVTYSEITNDEQFWNACKGCNNYNTLLEKHRKNCFCTAMLYERRI